MRYYLDFEATQPAQIITEMGCIREDGETFFSMCPAEGMTKVMNSFREYLKSDPNYKEAQFYVYGSSDKNWMLINAQRCDDFPTKLLMGFMAVQTFNYCAWFRKKYMLNIDPALETLTKAIDPTKKQTHNALDDAALLKWFVETEESMDPYEFIYKILVPYGQGIVNAITKREEKK